MTFHGFTPNSRLLAIAIFIVNEITLVSHLSRVWRVKGWKSVKVITSLSPTVNACVPLVTTFNKFDLRWTWQNLHGWIDEWMDRWMDGRVIWVSRNVLTVDWKVKINPDAKNLSTWHLTFWKAYMTFQLVHHNWNHVTHNLAEEAILITRLSMWKVVLLIKTRSDFNQRSFWRPVVMECPADGRGKNLITGNKLHPWGESKRTD